MLSPIRNVWVGGSIPPNGSIKSMTNVTLIDSSEHACVISVILNTPTNYFFLLSIKAESRSYSTHDKLGKA